jgi:hypothetical protein
MLDRYAVTIYNILMEIQMAMTNAERQARYRTKRKEQGLKRHVNWFDPNKPPEPKQVELFTPTAPDALLTAEKLKAAKSEGRRLARQADRTRDDGFTDGLCAAAAFFVRRGNPELARIFLAEHYIGRAKAAKCETFKVLDKAGVFESDKKPVVTQ